MQLWWRGTNGHLSQRNSTWVFPNMRLFTFHRKRSMLNNVDLCICTNIDLSSNSRKPHSCIFHAVFMVVVLCSLWFYGCCHAVFMVFNFLIDGIRLSKFGKYPISYFQSAFGITNAIKYLKILLRVSWLLFI